MAISIRTVQCNGVHWGYDLKCLREVVLRILTNLIKIIVMHFLLGGQTVWQCQILDQIDTIILIWFKNNIKLFLLNGMWKLFLVCSLCSLQEDLLNFVNKEVQVGHGEDRQHDLGHWWHGLLLETSWNYNHDKVEIIWGSWGELGDQKQQSKVNVVGG